MGRTIRYYAIAWFLMVLFATKFGIMDYLSQEFTAPTITLPQYSDNVAEVTTTDVLEITQYSVDGGITTLYFRAGSPHDANAQVVINGVVIYNALVNPGYVTEHVFQAKVPADANIVVRLVNAADGSVLKEVSP